jgi:glycerol-3-phosphate acyltransferase PlsX
MKIALDAMGGDFAPDAIVRGGILAAREFADVEILLVGDAGKVGEVLGEIKSPPSNISIVHAPEVIGMNEKPASALRKKKDSSIQVACKLVAEGRVQAVMSMGNTGASVAASLMILGRLKGVDRPAIAQFFPTRDGACLVLDVGATSNVKAEHLYQFALMGEVYYRLVMNKERPRVGLISIGEEDVKGNDVIREAHTLLDKAKINFVGNIEGRDILPGNVDVAVCDGFLGNVLLKFAESLPDVIFSILREQVNRNLFTRLGGLLMKPALHYFKKRFDYAEYGGAPLLGVNGISVVGHGKSSPKAILNAVRVTLRSVEGGINREIASQLSIKV